MRFRQILTLVLVLLGLCARSGWAQQSVAAADAVCGTCHATIYRAYLASPSANASGAAADRVIPGNFTHVTSGVHYTIAHHGTGAQLRFTDTHDARITGQRSLDYFLGSGHLGVTYLYTQQGYLLESPAAWYASTGSYDMKPGFGALAEMPPALPMEPNCLRCHMSGVAHAIPGTINRYSTLPFQQTGITCEGCHGDGSAHVRSHGKAAILNSAKLPAERRDALCMSCHLEGDVAVEKAGRSALDFHPGYRLADYLSYFVFTSKDPLSRGVSEVEQLSVSQCKRASGDRMSCTSCHDPHSSPPPEQRVAFYRAKCLACHSNPTFALNHHSEEPDCTSCHMPRSSAQNIPHVAWADHRILREPQTAPPAGSASKEKDSLVAIFSPEATDRDLAVAMYQAVVRGKMHDREAALARLKQVYADELGSPAGAASSAGTHDPQVLEGLGVLSGLNGDAQESERYLRQLLAVDPLNLTGVADLGVLLARQGKIQAAVDLWKPAFARNQDLIGLARNLAAGQCALGDSTGAHATVETALVFSPGVRAMWDFTCGASRSR
jgi:predicted CXXCH cytochrome family protein